MGYHTTVTSSIATSDKRESGYHLEALFSYNEWNQSRKAIREMTPMLPSQQSSASSLVSSGHHCFDLWST